MLTYQNTDTTFAKVQFGLWARCSIDKDLTLEVKLPRSEADNHRYQIIDPLNEHDEIRFGLPASILHNLVAVGLKNCSVLLETQLTNNPHVVSFRFIDQRKTEFSGCKIRARVPGDYLAIKDNLGLDPQDAPVPSVTMSSEKFKNSCKQLRDTDDIVYFAFQSTLRRFAILTKNKTFVLTQPNEERFKFKNIVKPLNMNHLREIAKASKLTDSVTIYAYSNFVRFLFDGSVLISYSLNASTASIDLLPE